MWQLRDTSLHHRLVLAVEEVGTFNFALVVIHLLSIQFYLWHYIIVVKSYLFFHRRCFDCCILEFLFQVYLIACRRLINILNT